MQINRQVIRIPAIEYAIIAAVKRELCSSSGDIAWELGLLHRRIIDVFHHDLLHPYYFFRGTHICLQPIFHRASSLANGYVSTLRMSSFHTSQIVIVRLVSLTVTPRQGWSSPYSRAGYQVYFSISVWADIVRDIAMGPYVLPHMVTVQRCNFLASVLLEFDI